MSDDENQRSILQERMTGMLAGKTISRIWLHRPSEIVIEMEDGTRLFVDGRGDLEFSITD